MNIHYHPFDEHLWSDPWPTYRALRDQDPVHFMEEFNAWVLTRFEDVWAASLDRNHYTAAHGTSPEALLLDVTQPPRVFLFMDPPDHRVHRGLVSEPYTVGNVAKLEKRIRETTQQVMAHYLPTGDMDVYRLASHVALHTISDLIGLTFEQIRHIRKLIDVYYQREPGRIGTTEKGLQAFVEANAYIRELIQDFRKSPPPEHSHIYRWLHADINGQGMSEDEIFFSIFALVITGSDTLPLTVAATLYYLSLQPETMHEVRTNAALIPNAFAEAARIDQPTNILGRTVAEDFELHGKALQKGQAVLFHYASANRDEREFEEPDEFRLHRVSKRNLSFGAGLHFCLGQHLARLEGRVILEEIFSTIDNFDVNRAESQRICGEFLQGFCYLPISFTPRSG